MMGLQRIADKPDLREVHEAQVSIYLKSGDEEAVRFYRKGQSMSGKDLQRGDHHPQHFMPFDFVTEAPGKVEIDLSVFCNENSDVLSEGQTETIKKTRKRKRSATDEALPLMHEPLDDKIELGHYKEELSIKEPVQGKVYTAYVCVMLDRFGATLFAVHTESGGKIPKLEEKLEEATVNAVIHNGRLKESFKADVGEKLCLVDVAQVVRSETFGKSDLGDFRQSVHTTNRSSEDRGPVLVPRSPPQGRVSASSSSLPPKIESDLGNELTHTGTAEFPVMVPDSQDNSVDDV
jgi:hypothetical protein